MIISYEKLCINESERRELNYNLSQLAYEEQNTYYLITTKELMHHYMYRDGVHLNDNGKKVYEKNVAKMMDFINIGKEENLCKIIRQLYVI